MASRHISLFNSNGSWWIRTCIQRKSCMEALCRMYVLPNLTKETLQMSSASFLYRRRTAGLKEFRTHYYSCSRISCHPMCDRLLLWYFFFFHFSRSLHFLRNTFSTRKEEFISATYVCCICPLCQLNCSSSDELLYPYQRVSLRSRFLTTLFRLW